MLFVTPVPAFALLFVGSLPLDVPGSSAQDRSIAMASIERSIDKQGDPVLMLGYWNRPAQTAAAYRGDWFLTGDLGLADAEGWIHFKGRADDVINSAGFRIGPAEVEGCLLEHPAVEQCAVIGVPDLMRGETVKAFVQLAPQFPPSPGLEVELREHVGRQLGAFQRPRDIQWVPELPMTVSGKIRRAELRARADAEGGRS
jgi:acetyl-CoA synthetase